MSTSESRIETAVRANPDITYCAECGCTVSRSHVHAASAPKDGG